MRQIAVHWGANGKPEMCGHYYLSFDKVSQSPFTAVFLFMVLLLWPFVTIQMTSPLEEYLFVFIQGATRSSRVVVLLALLAMNHLADNIEVSLQLLTNV